MTRGRYAARAKARLADLDNEILADVVAERDRLREEATELARKLKQLNANVDAEAMRRAGELSAAEVERLTAQLAQVQREHSEHVERLARDVFAAVRDYADTLRNAAENWEGWTRHLGHLADIFGMGNRLGELTSGDEQGWERSVRRTSAKKMRHAAAAAGQIRGAGRAVPTLNLED